MKNARFSVAYMVPTRRQVENSMSVRIAAHNAEIGHQLHATVLFANRFVALETDRLFANVPKSARSSLRAPCSGAAAGWSVL